MGGRGKMKKKRENTFRKSIGVTAFYRDITFQLPTFGRGSYFFSLFPLQLWNQGSATEGAP
jgi:hypothetical protein